MRLNFICVGCGKEYKRTVYDVYSSRDSKKYWNKKSGTEFGHCSECSEAYRKEEKERQYRKSCENAELMGYPKLIGSEAQIKWAMSIRDSIISYFCGHLEDDKRSLLKQFSIPVEDVNIATEYLVTNKTVAAWWIDNRILGITAIKQYADEYRAMQAKNQEYEDNKEIYEAAIVIPQNSFTSKIVKISVSDTKISVEFEKNDVFYEIIKKLKYTWEPPCWVREIDYMNGSSANRAAELGNKLLAAGFPISILNEETRNAAINGTYEEECTRWITWSPSKKKLRINWEGKDNKLYKRARSLPGSTWESGVYVSAEHFDEIEEFARLYDFRISDIAGKKISEEKAKFQNTSKTIITVKEKERPRDGLTDILNSDRNILPDLRDDD